MRGSRQLIPLERRQKHRIVFIWISPALSEQGGGGGGAGGGGGSKAGERNVKRARHSSVFLTPVPSFAKTENNRSSEARKKKKLSFSISGAPQCSCWTAKCDVAQRRLMTGIKPTTTAVTIGWGRLVGVGGGGWWVVGGGGQTMKLIAVIPPFSPPFYIHK